MSYKIPVYKAEVEAGLAEQVRATASVAYCVPLTPAEPNEALRAVASARKPQKPEGEPEPGDSKAAAEAGDLGTCAECGNPFRKSEGGAVACENGHLPPAPAASAAQPATAGFDPANDPALFYMRDVLASVGWNNNDDVFERMEMWVARHTSDHKPLNFSHDPDDICGHILTSEAFTKDGVPIPDDAAAEDVPAAYDIVNGSVIYRDIGSPERVAKIDKTIAEIRSGDWFVSMECWFTGFDYALRKADGTTAVVARAADTAFLTKHLRAYKGTGTFRDSAGNDYRVGRLFRNIHFIGKGLVRRPANKDSVILSTASEFHPGAASAAAVYEEIVSSNSNTETVPVPETSPDVAALEASVASLTASNDALKAELTTLKNAGHEAALAGLRADVAAKEAAVASLQAQVDTLTASVTEVTTRATAAETALTAANSRLAEVDAEKSKATRLALVTSKGLKDSAKASALVEKLSALTDSAFAETVEVLSPTWAVATKTVSEKDAIDSAVAEQDATLAVADDASDKTPEKAVAEYFESMFAPKTGRTAGEK